MAKGTSLYASHEQDDRDRGRERTIMVSRDGTVSFADARQGSVGLSQ